MAVQGGGPEVTVVAEKFGVSRQTVHAWLRRYEQGGLTAPRSPTTTGKIERFHRT
jgi:transposase